MYEHILVPTDGSPPSDRAVEHAARLAQVMTSSVTFLFVMDTLRAFDEGMMPQVRRQLEAEGRVALSRAEQAAASAGVAGAQIATELAEGSPAEVIVQRAPEFALVVMGSHGKGLWKRLVVGSVTQAVMHKIACPLLVVPGR